MASCAPAGVAPPATLPSAASAPTGDSSAGASPAAVDSSSPWTVPLVFVEETGAVTHAHGAYVARVHASDAAAYRAGLSPDGLVVCAAHAAADLRGPTVCYRVERPLPTYAALGRAGWRDGRLDECAGCHDAGPRLGGAR